MKSITNWHFGLDFTIGLNKQPHGNTKNTFRVGDVLVARRGSTNAILVMVVSVLILVIEKLKVLILIRFSFKIRFA